tara:strand:+ start:418 stop:1218 length:801 start_codon:yes stop_codon:yes gene_type:complete
MNDLDKAKMMAPEGEFLAYINPKEAGILKALGGSGRMTSMGIPSFTEDEEDTGDVANPGSGFSGDTTSPGDDQEDDTARMMQDMGLTGPGFTSRGPVDDNPPTISDIIGGGVQNIKNYLTDPSRRTGILSGLIGSALFGPFAGLVAGSLGQRFASRNNNLLTGMNTIDYDNTPPVTSPFILPEPKPFRGSGNIPPIFYDSDISDLMANKLFDYKIGDISDKTFNGAINAGFNPYTGEELKPGEAEDLKNERNKGTGINTIDTTMIV